MKIKLHLNTSQAEESDQQALLNYYNDFSHTDKYAVIKLKHFKLKSMHNRKTQKSNDILLNSNVKEFEMIQNKMNNFSSDEKHIEMNE